MRTVLTGGIPTAKLTLPDVRRDHIQGSPNAKMLLLEYGDYQCPFCGEAYVIVKEVQERLGDRLCFAFRNFPLTNMHPDAEHAAEAAEAAGAQEKFWEMHDTLFENQDALTDKDIAAYAAELGLDARRLVAEVLSRAHVGRVREDFRSGVRCDVNGTPTFFINGVRYDGPPGLEPMLAALTETELA
jgi:protein-disulfide isomerase